MDMTSESGLRERLCDAGHILESEGQGDYCMGHVSLRTAADPDRILMKAAAMGLVNRTVGRGEALGAARDLAAQIAAFPQRCMRSDRMSAYEAWTRPLDDALRNEYRHGIATIDSGETRQGAARFASGVGRHGKF